MRALLLASAILFISIGYAQRPIAVRCGTVFIAETGGIKRDQVIRLEKGRISSMTDAGSYSPGADSVIDLSAYFVLPGLIDAHTHVLLQQDVTADEYAEQLFKESIPYRTLRAARSASIALGNGFTTIRDLETEGALYADVDIKKAINRHIIEGPRMQVATRAINTTGHYALSPNLFNWELDLPKGIQEVTGADEARRAAREQISHGADWIKIYADRSYYRKADGSYSAYPNFTKEEMFAVIDEAIRSGKKIAVHAMTREGIIDALNMGASSIEHGFGMDDECIHLLVQKNAYWCPTIYICDYMAPGRAQDGSPINMEFMKTFPALFAKAIKAGVRIAYGTDIGGYSWDLPEAKDFEYMVRWGMTPAAAIQTATVNAARLLGLEGRAGTLAPGAYADIIAVKGDVLKDITILQHVSWVMKDGVVIR